MGSEYVAQIVNNAPNVQSEMYVTNFMRNCYNKYDPISEKENYSSLVFNMAYRIRMRWGRVLDPHKVLNECQLRQPVSYGLLYDKMMRDLIPNEAEHWVEKMQLEWRSIPDFLDMFSDGKAILVVRDPRSILASFKKFTYASYPRYLGAVFNALDSMKAGIKYSKCFDESQFHIVRYEDVICKAEPTVRELLEFLGLSAEHNLLSQEGWTDTSGNKWNENSAFDDGQDFDKDAAVNRWRDNLDEWEISFCEWVNRDMMEAYGYEVSDASVSRSEYLEVIEQDEQIASFFKHWKKTGEGIEQYPEAPKNWTTRQN